MNRAKQQRQKRRENTRYLLDLAEFKRLPVKILYIPIGNIGMSRRPQTFEEWRRDRQWNQWIREAFLRLAKGE